MIPRGWRVRRLLHRRLLRVTIYALGALVLLDILTVLKSYRRFCETLQAHTYTEPSTLPTLAKNQKIFIVATFWTNAYVIYHRWAQALVDLVQVLGPDNVYVSIYESGSIDNTKEMLQWLDSMLVYHFPTIQKTITLDNTTHQDEMDATPFDEQGNPRSGWILPPQGTNGKEIRRIPYLSRLRNLSLQPLLDQHAKGHTYDKILFLNDVVFKPSDVLSLLATNQGSFSAACAIDYHLNGYLAHYYDTFAVRDVNGNPTLTTHFPYFRPSSSLTSLQAGSAVKVRSCWNGMVLMDSTPFTSTRPPTLPNPMSPTSLGLPFRGIPDSLASKHLEGSECCLIHADLASTTPHHSGIYLNPAVRAAYTIEAYNTTHFGPDESTFLSPTQFTLATWRHRLATYLAPTVEKQLSIIHARVEQWLEDPATLHERRSELGDGEMCLIDEMHLLIWNGWKHV
jgi:hypothetical protein